MAIDDRILQDITERLSGEEISAAKALAPVAKMTKRGASQGFSTKGIPGYFCGKRDAQTVVVNLNPGIDADIADRKWIFETKYFDKTSIQTFENDYKDSCINYGKNDRMRYDPFDVKQAAFLYDWSNSGINFSKPIDWTSKTKKDLAEKKETSWLDAKENVLMDKLQLELIPYASAKFKINKKNIGLLKGYVDTLLEEIFKKERTYVIFASDIFERLFKYYNEYTKTKTFEFCYKEKKDILKNRNGKCKVIYIHYNNTTQKALIAHTFPSQSLCNAFGLMQKYGQMCYNEYISHP